MAETLIGAEPYSLESISLARADGAAMAEWDGFRRRQTGDFPLQDPVWLRGYFDGQLDNLNAYLLYRSGQLSGIAPFLRKDWPLQWHLGEVAIAKPPLRRLRLLGGTLNLPEDEAAYDTLFRELAQPSNVYDALQFEEVPLDSFLWKYLQTSPLIRRCFRTYAPSQPASHLLLRFTSGSFVEYMDKFSRKHRHELRREMRRVREGALGEMRFVEYTRPEEVDEFLGPAVEVSKKTYQWILHQRGLSATDLLRKRMLFAAGKGWFRSYLMFCGGVPAAFLAGFQYGSRYLPLEMGFDPGMAKYSVGTVLQLLVVEDLFGRNRPEILDLGGYGTWKDVLSTEAYLETQLLLFRPNAYTRFVQEGHRACRFASKTATAALDRLQLKSRIKRVIRNLGTSRGGAQKPRETRADEK